MNIAILGMRGLPSTYSGFETFVGELAPRLVQRGHSVSIYCRKSLYDDRPEKYQEMRMYYLPSIENKYFSTFSHSFLSLMHAAFRSVDVILVVNAANGIFGFIPRVFLKRCVLNVDGMEWLRPKWNAMGKWFFKFSARMGTKFYDAIVTDAEEMHRLYAKEFGIDSTYIAYGANIEYSSDPDVIYSYGLEPNSYYLIASRLVPDNNADVIIEGFIRSKSSKVLAIAGGADYKGNTIEQKFIEKIRYLANDRVKFLGHVGDPRHVIELHCNAFAYIHGHQYGGINPALLKALGCGNLVLANNTPFNSEVLARGEFGIIFEKNPDSIAEKIILVEKNTVLREQLRMKARQRIMSTFTWDKITSQYIELFENIVFMHLGGFRRGAET